jgi:putative ABC transport system permease protein
MNPLATLRVAMRAILRNKLRAFLTTLGIIIGVSAVIAMVAIGEGAKAKVAEQFSSMGSNLLIVMSGSASAGGSRGGFGSMPTLTWDDLNAVQTEVPAVRWVAPVQQSRASLVGDDQNWSAQVSGTTPDYFNIRSWKPAYGELFTQSDAAGGTKVAVLGRTVCDKLFATPADAIGQAVRIKNIPFTVIAVLETKGQSAMGQDFDDVVIIPLKAFQTKIQGGLQKYLAGIIFVGAWSAETTSLAETQIRSLLRDRHHLAAGTEDDFNIRNLTEMASAMEAGTDAIATFLAVLAGISLVVGGIGIMNIMLVSVTERTREIGLRMAVGAKPRQILTQFLVEALCLSLAGGLVGIILGISGAMLTRQFTSLQAQVSPAVVVIAVGFSALVGVIFGLYPAYKASRLDPIDALRYE